MPYAVKLLNNISAAAKELLPEENYVLGDAVAAPDAILVRSADMHSYERNPELAAVARAGAGVNNIPIDACAEDGVVVFNTPGANANAVKELVVCALLLTGRDLLGGIAWARGLAGEEDVEGKVEKGKKNFVGGEILGKTLGVVGLGAIGLKVALAAAALGMKVVGYDPMLTAAAKAALPEDAEVVDSLEALWPRADYVTLHLPQNAQTKGIVGKDALASMKQGAILLNMARGGLVDDAALLEALDSGHLGRYVTDFPNAAVVAHPKVVPVPHLGASTPESEENCALMAAAQLRDYLEDGIIRNSVNYPAFDAPRATPVRLCLLHKSEADLGEEARALLADCGVAALYRNERGAVAYSVVDLEKAPAPEQLAKLAALSGLLRLRCL
ncbi:MAG: 3-phosphoglycerate dehydrogenase [Clostridia bacterium]|nr:3-phosphoglycerate dehydrogenase [Clostridia bacterium]